MNKDVELLGNLLLRHSPLTEEEKYWQLFVKNWYKGRLKGDFYKEDTEFKKKKLEDFG